MRRETALQFVEPKDAELLSEEPLVIHQRQNPTTNRKLIVFVHGLGGRRYGQVSTWGSFPRFIFEDIPEVDIGMYQYRTGTERFHFTKSVSLQDESRVFSDLMRDQLKEYTTILLAGHSMGGLLCKAAICQMVAHDRDTLARIGGLILMATPQLGSLHMPAFLSGLFNDARALEPHGELATEINRVFEDHIALDENVYTLRKTTIPTWAIEAVHDQWVDSLSAGIGLASSRRKVVRGSHTSIVKPPDKDSDAYAWVRERISIALNRFKYDVFLAAPMAGHDVDASYEETRNAVLALIETLKTKCGCSSVFYAGTNILSKDNFEPNAVALQDDLDAMRKSKNFIMYYPKRIASSVLYEAGWALMLGKPSIYIIGDKDNESLPFLLNDAGQAFEDRRVRIFKCPNRESMLKHVAQYGNKLFRPGD